MAEKDPKKILDTQKQITEETRKRNEEQKKLNDQVSKEEELAKIILNKRKKTVGELKKEKEMLESLLEIQTDGYEILQTNIDLHKKRIEILEQDISFQEKIYAANIARTKEQLKFKQITQEEYEERIENNKKLYKDLLGRQKKELEVEKQSLNTLKESEKALERIAERTSDIIKVTTGISDKWKTTWVGTLVQASKVTDGFSMALSNAGKQIKSQVTVSNLLGSSLLKVQEATLHVAQEQDNAVSAFNRSEGAAGAYDDVILDVGHHHTDLGVYIDEAANSVAALKDQFTDFTLVGREAQTLATEFTAIANEFGVSLQDTSVIFQELNKQMGLNIEESIKAQKEIMAVARALGDSAGRMAMEFAKALPRLAVFGKEGVKVFKELATVAKATGIEISNLLDLSERFETFEGAAESVGKLNAILGGNFLDAMTMTMTVDPTERIKLMRQAVDSAGLSFETMGHFQRRAIADAMGLKNVSELSKILSGDINDLSEAAKAEALAKEEMRDMAQKAQSIMDKLKSTMHAFAVSLTPVINFVRTLLETFLNWNQALGGFLIPTLIGFLTVIKLIGSNIALNTVLMFKNIAASITSVTWTKIKTAASAMFTKAKIAENVVESKSIPIKYASAAATTAAVGPTLALGAAILLVGGGIALATFGIASMINAIKGLTAGEFVMLAGILVGIGVGLYFLIPALMAFAATAGVAAIPMLALGGALLLIGAGIFLVTSGVAMVIEALAKFSNESVNNLSGVASAIYNIADAIGEIPLLKSLGFTAMVMSIAHAASELEQAEKGTTAFKEVIQTTNMIEDEAVRNVKEIVEQARIYRETKEQMSVNIFDPFVDMLKGAIGVKPAKGKGVANGNINVTLEVGGRALDKYIIDVVEGELKPRST